MSNSAYEQKLGHVSDSIRVRDVFVRDGHGFWTGAAVRWNQTLESWDLADAASVTGAEAVGVVEVRDTFRFDVVLSGAIDNFWKLQQDADDQRASAAQKKNTHSDIIRTAA